MPAESKSEIDGVQAFKKSILGKLKYAVGRDPSSASDHDWFEAVALAARDHVVDRWEEASADVDRQPHKRIYYLSLEFLIGRLLVDNLSNLGLLETARHALAELNVDLEHIRQLEPDAALGNGGLGRLAACFMESMATLGLSAHGYGIRYEHGLFRQAIADGWQLEQTFHHFLHLFFVGFAVPNNCLLDLQCGVFSYCEPTVGECGEHRTTCLTKQQR